MSRPPLLGWGGESLQSPSVCRSVNNYAGHHTSAPGPAARVLRTSWGCAI